ncbi:MAG: RES family NAD+ phosphorylase [Bdellovibrionota bacterium]
MPIQFKNKIFDGHVFRNIYTIKNSQNLFDELCDTKEENSILNYWSEQTSYIDHKKPQQYRFAQYAEIANTPFPPTPEILSPLMKAGKSRFSDGSFGVWYSALDEKTSISETLYWSYRHWKKDIEIAKNPYVTDRKIFRAKIKTTKLCDLSEMVQEFPNLIHKEDYTFCQNLGKSGRENLVEAFLTLSVREEGGKCMPIFVPQIIEQVQFIRFWHYTFYKDGRYLVTKDTDYEAKIPKDW